MSIVPDELLRDIFDQAIGDDPILNHEPWSIMAESSWCNMLHGWELLEPYQNMQREQRKGHATKKAIMLTCKKWSRVAEEFMYRSFLVGNINHLRSLCAVLDRNSSLGWWTKGIYLYRDPRIVDQDFAASMGDCISTLIRHCPQLQSFVADPVIDGLVFPIIADAVRTYCSKLSSVRWQAPLSSQGLLIPALKPLQKLTSLHFHVSVPANSHSPEGTFHSLRSFTDVSFPRLESLSMRGTIQDLVEDLPSWHLPQLSRLSLDFGLNQHDFPDLLEAISPFGLQLRALDLDSIPTLDVPRVLSLCPNLVTFCFNLDWSLDGCLTASPHKSIELIGLHGLKYAFGVGFASSVNPFDALVVRRRNDHNFAALTKKNFPRLSLVRALGAGLLRDLNKANGPAPGVCYSRWERWWEQCAEQGVRLQDCTGSLLGTLPATNEDDEGSDFEDDEESLP